jgi:phosphatidylglycerol:prolipoprotein diacylglycerol transferase
LRFRSESLGLDVRTALDVGLFSSFIGLIGARLFHVLYEYPDFYFRHPSFIFKLWEGGFVFLAGILAGIGVGILWLKKKRLPLLPWLDLFAPLIGLGYSMGRWACFFQGCCYGKQTDSIFGVHFHNIEFSGESFGRYPTQIITAGLEFFLVLVLLLVEKRGESRIRPGVIFCLWIVGHGFNRMIMELLRDDPRGPLILGFGVSFWIAIMLVISGALMMRAILSSNPVAKD